MITKIFSCRRSVPAIFRLLAAAIPTIVPFGFAAAQQPPSFTDQRGVAARLPHPSDLAFRRWKYFYEPRAYPFGRIPPGAYQSALQDYNQKWSSAERQSVPGVAPASAAITGTIWKPIGPAPIATSPTTAGRINSIAIHPFDPHIIYVGGAEGGVWKTVDRGQSWVPLTDRQCSLAMGAIAIDPINPNIVYAGTGDENFEHDAYSGCGVLRSTDSGATWTQLGASIFVSPSGGSATISRIVVDPTTAGSATTTKIYVASSLGVYRSTDSGATWNLLAISSTCNARSATDLVVDPATPANVYAALGNKSGTPPGGNFLCNGVYKSTDGGASWSRLGAWGGYQVGRINLAISRSAPATLYASASWGTISPDPRRGTLLGIAKTTDSGATWRGLAASGADCSDQCWFTMYLAVDPTNANVVYFGGRSLYKSVDGGASFADIGMPIHVDHHAFAFHPINHNVIYTGSDGGIFRSADGGSTWTSLNTNLALTQFYPGISLHPTNPSIAMAGAQDNDVDLYTGAKAWTPMPIPLQGDGGFTAIDFVTPTTGYAEVAWIIPGQGPFRTENFLSAAPDWRLKASGINANDQALFIPPLVMSPTNSQTLYFGTTNLYRTTNRGDTWTTILTTGGISAIAEAKSNSSVIYVGTSGGNVQITQNGGLTWTPITTGLPNRAVTYLAISPSDATTAFVVVSGFGTGHVFKTTNSGGTWSDISSNLQNIPVNTILLDPGAPTTNIYIGTDLGVFRTTNGGTTWAPFKRGLPKVAVLDLAFNQGTNVLMAATHGRGAWKIAAANRPAISVAPPTHDYGSVVHGATADALFTVTNIGQGVLTGSALLSGSGAFSIVSGETFNLITGASQAITVRFAPSTVGHFDTDCMFSSNGGIAEAVLSGAGN